MPNLTRPDPTATCNPRDLAQQISTAVGKTVTCDIDGPNVIVYENLTAAEVEQTQAVVDAYIFNPDFGKTTEELSVKADLAQKVPTLNDNTAIKATWDGLTAVQRQEASRVAIQVLVRLCRFIAKRML